MSIKSITSALTPTTRLPALSAGQFLSYDGTRTTFYAPQSALMCTKSWEDQVSDFIREEVGKQLYEICAKGPKAIEFAAADYFAEKL